MADLKGKKIAVLGGGLREAELVNALLECGAEVAVSGLTLAGQLRLAVQSPEAATENADALVLPVSGLTPEGKIKEVREGLELTVSTELLGRLKSGAPVVVGKANEWLERVARQTGCRLIELVDDDEFAILNAIPTAEGALVVAIEASTITLHGSDVFVLGYGRCGRALARVLVGVGARVHVIERSPVKRAMATEAAVNVYPFTDLKSKLRSADFIFNTVPSLVLTTDVLENLKPDCVIIDIASAPGGVDFAAAKALGIQAILALGLPGRYSPKTAGKILATIVPRKLTGYLA